MIGLLASNDTMASWMIRVADALHMSGESPRFFTPGGRAEGAEEYLADHGYDFTIIGPHTPITAYGLKALTVGNDWGEPERTLVTNAKDAGILTVGVQEGMSVAEPGRTYATVEVFCASSAAFALHLGRPDAHITGMPLLERISPIRRRGKDNGVAYALINFNFAYHRVPESYAREWLSRAVLACVSTQRPYKIALHPRATRWDWLEDYKYRVTNVETIVDVLADARVLISPPSTVILEAMIMGVPPIYTPTAASTFLDAYPDPAAFTTCDQYQIDHYLPAVWNKPYHVPEEYLNRANANPQWASVAVADVIKELAHDPPR